MKKETLIKLIDEEFGDNQPFSWLIDVVIKTVIKNDSRVKECTKFYEEQYSSVISYLDELRDGLLDSEKEESQSIRVTHKRKVNNSKTEDKE